MKKVLSKFCNHWDEAALETLGSEFQMQSLMQAQSITSIQGDSLLDNISFDDYTEVVVPESLTIESTYFKAPWED
jgi:hypothetical protein